MSFEDWSAHFWKYLFYQQSISTTERMEKIDKVLLFSLMLGRDESIDEFVDNFICDKVLRDKVLKLFEQSDEEVTDID